MMPHQRDYSIYPLELGAFERQCFFEIAGAIVEQMHEEAHITKAEQTELINLLASEFSPLISAGK